jgi:hypothetical protein
MMQATSDIFLGGTPARAHARAGDPVAIDA